MPSTPKRVRSSSLPLPPPGPSRTRSVSSVASHVSFTDPLEEGAGASSLECSDDEGVASCAVSTGGLQPL